MIAINRPYMIYGLFLGFLDFLVVCFVEVWFWSLGLWHLKFESCGNTISALVQGYPPFLGIMVVGNPLDNKVVALEEPPLDSNWDTSSGRSLLFRQLRRGVHCRDFQLAYKPSLCALWGGSKCDRVVRTRHYSGILPHVLLTASEKASEALVRITEGLVQQRHGLSSLLDGPPTSLLSQAGLQLESDKRLSHLRHSALHLPDGPDVTSIPFLRHGHCLENHALGWSSFPVTVASQGLIGISGSPV